MIFIFLPGHLVYTFDITAAKDHDKNSVKVVPRKKFYFLMIILVQLLEVTNLYLNDDIRSY